MRRTLPAAVLLSLVVLGVTGVAPAAAQTVPAPSTASGADQCLYNQAQPPAAADGTVVLAAHQTPTDARFAAEIIPADGQFHSLSCNLQVSRQPTSIGVGKGAAIQFWDITHNLVSSWGAVNVSPTDPAPVFFPGRSDFRGPLVYVADAVQFTSDTDSCRACVLSGATLRLPADAPGAPGVPTAYTYDLTGAQLDSTTVVARSDFSGYTAWMAGWNLRKASLRRAKLQANLTGATLTGAVLDGADLSQANLTGAVLATSLEHVIGLNAATLDGADLSGASLNGLDLTGAKLDGVTVNGTVFDRSDLRGARLTQLKFTASPSFNFISVGQANGACTIFQDLDLHAVSLVLAEASPGCESSPLLPGTRVSLDLLASLYRDPALAGLAPTVNLQHARFVADASNRSSLAGLDLHGINLTGAAFLGWPIDLSGTKLDGASLQGTQFELAELAGATFHGANAAGASFRGAHLAAVGGQPATSFAGAQTNLHGANFIEADVSGAQFSSADLSADPATGTPTAFDRALARATDFTGVKANRASFVGAHIYGNGRAFDQATDLSEVDFTNALLAGDVKQGGGFDLAGAPLTKATFNGAQCIACNFTGAHLDQASLVGAYLPGATLSNAILDGANLDNAWLYCGDRQNTACLDRAGHLSWKLQLGFGEVFGPVPFTTTNLTSAPLSTVAICPDGRSRDASTGCPGDRIMPSGSMPALPIACSEDNGRGAVALRACPTTTSTLFAAPSNVHPLAVAAVNPATWATTLNGKGFYVGLDDATIRLVGDGSAQLVAGQAGQPCAAPTATCGDGGPPGEAQVGTPSGLAVGLDGSVYVADSGLHRVRRIGFDGNSLTTITTVAGNGQSCDGPTAICGDGGLATDAQLSGPNSVYIDPSGHLWIADGSRGLREVLPNGTITSVTATPGAYTIQSVIGDANGNLYAAASEPDSLLMVVPPAPPLLSLLECRQLGLEAGELIQTSGNPEIDIVDRSCSRHGVPDPATLAQIQTSYAMPLKSLDAAAWQAIPVGPAIAAADSDPVGFTRAMWQIFPPVCVELGVVVGDLVQASGNSEIDLIDGSCRLRHVPDPTTLNQIQQTYNAVLFPLPQSDYVKIPVAPAVPDASTDPTAFDLAMQQIFGPPRTSATLETPSVAAPSVGGQVTTVAGTGTSGYNGTIGPLGQLLRADQVQINRPLSVAVRADGAILFADTGNNLIRAYIPAQNPASRHVVDLGGLVVSGTPQGGSSQDGLAANKTALDQPGAVTATGLAASFFVIADTGSGRVRLLGPNALGGASPTSIAPDGLEATPTPPAASSAATPLPTPTQPVVSLPTPAATATPTPAATATLMPAATATPTPDARVTPPADRTATPPADRTPGPGSTSTATPIPALIPALSPTAAPRT